MKPALALDATSLLDALEEGVVVIDGDRVVFVNRAAAAMLEVDAAFAVGRPSIGVLRDHRLEEALVAGRPVDLETRGRHLQAVPVDGALLLRDRTELRRAQHDARELLAVLSHELRTPVTAIRAALEALSDRPPDGLRERFLARATQEADRLVRLLEDLTVEVRPPRARSLMLDDLARRAAGVVQPTLQRHRIRLRLEVPEVAVWADEDKLLQVLINLLENAAVHGPDDGEVTLEATEVGASVRVEVLDDGEPLDPDHINELFEPHSRGGTVKAKGTGLGLTIVRSIAQQWGGEAWGGPRRDRPNGPGNVFGVSVPRPRAASSDRDAS